jgi:hypothetical protein
VITGNEIRQHKEERMEKYRPWAKRVAQFASPFTYLNGATGKTSLDERVPVPFVFRAAGILHELRISSREVKDHVETAVDAWLWVIMCEVVTLEDRFTLFDMTKDEDDWIRWILTHNPVEWETNPLLN